MALFRIDRDNDLIIVQTRNRGTKVFGKYEYQLYRAIEEGLID
jgi:hypothetical protein